MHCENCGSQVLDSSAFCSECGARIEKQDAPPTPPPSQQGYFAPQPAPVYAPEPQNYSSSYSPPPSYAATASSEPYVKPLGVGSYIGMMLLTAIPIVGIILIFVWAFSSDTNLNKKNYARAVLIMMLVSVVLAFIFGGLMAGIINMIGESLSYY